MGAPPRASLNRRLTSASDDRDGSRRSRPMLHHHDLPCGCGTCGCICAEHAVDRQDRPCRHHLLEAIARAAAVELARLVAIGLFVAVAAAWCAILAYPRI